MSAASTATWRRLLRRLPGHPSRWPRRLRLTRDGRFVVVLTFGIGFAAINTGHNLLYLMLSVLLATMVASGVLSEAVLRGVAVRRAGPRRFVAGQRALTAYEVHNGKRRLPSVALEVWERWEGPAPVQCERALVVKLPPGQRVTASCGIAFGRRGIYRSQGVVLGTGFPFSMFLKTRFFPGESVAIVHPAPLDAPVRVPAPPPQGARGTPMPRAGREGDFYGVRDVRPGDSVRAVHWKLTARRRRPVCVEFERPREEMAVLVVDLRTGAQRGSGDAEGVEQAIRRAADTARALSARGWAVGLVAAHATVEPQVGPGQLERLLDALAWAPVLDAPDPSLEALRHRARRLAPAALVVAFDGAGERRV